MWQQYGEKNYTKEHSLEHNKDEVSNQLKWLNNANNKWLLRSKRLKYHKSQSVYSDKDHRKQTLHSLQYFYFRLL